MEQQDQTQQQPAQHQERQPGIESAMTPRPRAEDASYRGSGKAPGAGRVNYRRRQRHRTRRSHHVCAGRCGCRPSVPQRARRRDRDQASGGKRRARRCATFAGDIGQESFCREVVERTVAALGQLDILVNNAAEQHPQDSIAKISAEQLNARSARTFSPDFYMSKQLCPIYMPGSVSLTPPRSPPTKAARSCSTTPPRKAPLWPLRARYRRRWWGRASA